MRYSFMIEAEEVSESRGRDVTAVQSTENKISGVSPYHALTAPHCIRVAAAQAGHIKASR
jgi:hypothetical protein